MGKRHYKNRKARLKARKIRLSVIAAFLLILWLILRVDVVSKAIEVVAAALFEVLLAD